MANLRQIKAQAKVMKEKITIDVKEINGKSIDYTLSEGIVNHMNDFENSLNQKRFKNLNIKNRNIAIKHAMNSATKNVEKDSVARGEYIFKYFEDELCTLNEVFNFCETEHKENAQLLYNNFMKSIANDFAELMMKMNNSNDDIEDEKGK